MRGRELGDKRTQLGFCRSSRQRRLGAARDLDFDLDGTASGGFFLHAHDGSLGLDFCGRGSVQGCCAPRRKEPKGIHVPHCALYGLASRKSFTIGTMTVMRCISVTWVVSGKMANRDAERGFMSPWTSPPFRRNISATCSSRTPSASPWMKNIGAVVALSLSAPKSCPFAAVARSRLTKFGKSSGVGLSFLYSVSMGEPLKASAVSFGIASSASATMPSLRNVDEMMTALRTLSGWRIAHCIATAPPML